MKNLKLAPLALVVFVLASAFAAYLTVYSQTLPPTRSQTIQLASYVQQGRYDYVATLAPNTLYNTTTLMQGQGTLFEAITKSINLTFTFGLNASESINTVLTSTYAVILQGPAWNLTLYRFPANTVSSSSQYVGISQNFFINITRIVGMIRSIETQTGYVSPEYLIVIQPHVSGPIEASGQTSNLDFLPSMSLKITGGIILPGGTRQSLAGSIAKTTTIEDGQTTLFRQISYASLAVSTAGLTISTYFATRPQKRTLEEDLQITTRPYREIITGTNTPPPHDVRQISAESWPDLVRVADTLGRPILHFTKPEENKKTHHIFYVLDGTASYSYSTET